jgi:para-nitrobenzyl esterase
LQDTILSIYNYILVKNLLILVIAVFFTPLTISESENTIQTSSGISHGYINNSVLNWDDIPYAQPPVGDLRWKAPKPLGANAYLKIIKPLENNFCVQEPSGLGGSQGNSYFSGSEDCLYLDIKRPKRKNGELLPVMFWIHGGGNTSGMKDLYDFSNLVKKHDVLVVSINYRLGPFGWFTHPSIQDLQSDLDKTSNFGTLDIISALEWVQSNIYLFGGDPNNVTIFGESAGGHNVLSLLVAKQAKGLFHKAISQSGYTTTYSKKDAFKQTSNSPTSKHTSWNIVNKIIKDKSLDFIQDDNNFKVRELLKGLTAEEFFKYFSERPSYENLTILTGDGIVIPEIGLKKALSMKEYVNHVPTIAGSNKDEVKLWLASAKYFVDLDYSFFGSIFGVPKVVLNDKDAFNLFNSYRSRAWKIRGVDEPLRSLHVSGNKDLYAYRYDWDDHRRFIIADFRELIGAAHATEIPLLTGNNKLVGDYGFLIYPKGPSKRFTSKNMMKFWTNFAKNGKPGISSNGVEWLKYNGQENTSSNYIVLDNKRNLRMQTDEFSFSSLIKDLHQENALTNLEKCVVLLQMLTYVGHDIYDQYVDDYPGKCDRALSEQFLKDNASFIDY